VMKADIFQRNGGKTLAFDDVAKGDLCEDNVDDDVDMTKVLKGSGDKDVNNDQVKEQCTPSDHKTLLNDATIHDELTEELVGTIAGIELIQAHYNSVGVDLVNCTRR